MAPSRFARVAWRPPGPRACYHPLAADLEGTHVLKAVLFDLDGTLLDLDLGGFLDAYFHALGPALAELADHAVAPGDALNSVLAATNAMCGEHPGLTNRRVFHETFAELSGIDLDDPVIAAGIDGFYREQFPSLRADYGPMPGGAQAVAAAREAGFLVAVATNPIFPEAAIFERIRWAGYDPDSFDLVTTYDNSEACKPSPRYFRGVAQALGVEPSECLMIGDDPGLDLAAADIGMQTFFARREGVRATAASTWAGTLEELADLLGRLAP